MNSYKQWKILNESYFPGFNLGLSQPQTIGGLQSNLPGVNLSEKKKMDGKVVSDEEDLGDDYEDTDDTEKDDEEGCKCKAFSKKHMKKKMTKKMKDVVPDEEDDGNDEEHDVNDVETPEDDDHDEEDHDEEDHDEEDGEEHGEDHDEEDGEEAKDMAKYGFMKDKKDKKKDKKKSNKKEKTNESAFWGNLNNYYVPKNSEETDKEFFESLARQYGKPEQERFSGGVLGDGINEDLLLSDDQEALINAMPTPGEAGYPIHQRLGGDFSSSESPDIDFLNYGESEDSEKEIKNDYKVLKKYFNEEVAKQLINKRFSD